MTTQRIGYLLSLAFLLAALVHSEGDGAVARAQARAQPLAVVVSADSPTTDVSHALLRRIFLGEPTHLHGTRFVPLNYGADDPLRIAFDEAVLGFSPAAAGRYWVDRRIRGQGLPPRAISSPVLMRAVVAKLPGAIGYLPVDQLNPSVRALTIDGVPHHDPEYLLAGE